MLETPNKLLKKKRNHALFMIAMGLLTYMFLTVITLIVLGSGMDAFFLLFLVVYMFIQLYGVYHYTSLIIKINYDLKRQEIDHLTGTVESLHGPFIRIKEDVHGIARINLFKGYPEDVAKYEPGKRVRVGYLKKSKYLVEIKGVK